MQLIRFCFPNKTASMFAHRILKAMSEVHGLAYFSPNNIPPNHEQLVGHLGARADDIVLFGPARRYCVGVNALAALAPGDRILDICQIRHPLDIIVSQYFSHGWIHPDGKWLPEALEMRREIQAGRVSVAQYALLELQGRSRFGGRSRAETAGASLVEKMRALDTKPDITTRLIVTYEQFHDDYDVWARRIADFLPGDIASMGLLLELRPVYDGVITLPQDAFFADPLEYVEAFGIRRGRHIRSAAPGDHRHFLTREQITSLMGVFLAACPGLRAQYGD